MNTKKKEKTIVRTRLDLSFYEQKKINMREQIGWLDSYVSEPNFLNHLKS